MAQPADLEQLRQIFRDGRVHLAIGVITQLELAGDRSTLYAKVRIFPENNEVVAQMTWEQVGPDAGIFGFPVVNDMVLVGNADGDSDTVFVLKRLTSKTDKIPIQAVDGHTVVRALAGKKTHVLSNTAVLLGRGGADPTQPLVLGTVFKTAYSTDLAKTAAHKHVGNLGYLTFVPDNAADFLALKASPVDDVAMLSDLSKTEK